MKPSSLIALGDSSAIIACILVVVVGIAVYGCRDSSTSPSFQSEPTNIVGERIEAQADTLIEFPNTILFDSASTVLHESVQLDLLELSDSVRDKNLVIVITGHTSTDEPNGERLSLQRSEVVQDYLISNGNLLDEQIWLDAPRASMDTLPGIPGDSPLNRRVELSIF